MRSVDEDCRQAARDRSEDLEGLERAERARGDAVKSLCSRHRLEELVASIDYGVTASATTAKVGPQFLRITDIQDDQVDWRAVPHCEASVKAEGAALLQVDDIVFARTGATTGKSFLIRACPERVVFASYLIRVRPNRSRVEPRYLAWYFQTPEYWRQITSSASGTAQPGVNASKLGALSIPILPLPEQRRIADILDKADAVRRKRKEAIALTEDLLRSAFLEMFGDPVTNPKGWPVQELNDFISDERPITYGILKPGPDTPDGVPYVRVVDIKDGRVKSGGVRRTTREIDHEFRRSRLRAGDLLMSIRGHVGRLAVVPPELQYANITQDTARISPVGLDPSYLMNLIETEAIQFWMFKHVRGVAVRGINIGDVRRIPVPVPPPALQTAFAKLVSTTLRNRSAARLALAEAEALFGALVQRAFSCPASTAEQSC